MPNTDYSRNLKQLLMDSAQKKSRMKILSKQVQRDQNGSITSLKASLAKKGSNFVEQKLEVQKITSSHMPALPKQKSAI